MPCSEKELEFNPSSISPGLPIPGFGFPFAPSQPPSPENALPTEATQDVLALVNKLSLIFPSSIFKPNADLKMKTVLDAFANLMSQIAPYLSFYNFIIAALRLLTCIIEVLCAIPNPLAMVAKVKKLLTECLPPFLAMFPWAALPIMVISLLQLILALLEYIFATLQLAVETTLGNLTQMSEAIILQDADATLGAATKIAGILCFLDNVFAVFVALSAIMNIIQSLAALAGGGICDDSSECCIPENCPDFLKLFPNGQKTTSGRLVYHSKVEGDIDSIVPGLSVLFTPAPLREESWQLFDLNQQQYPISDIITPINGKIFWPDEVITLSNQTNLKKVPYLVDLEISLNPHAYDSNAPNGTKLFIIKNIIVKQKPYIGVINYKNENLLTNTSGTFQLVGGEVFHSDGTTPYIVNGKQAKLENLLHLPALKSSTGLPTVDDAISYQATFTWRGNSEALVDYKIITLGCFPTIASEKTIQNAIQAAKGNNSFLNKIAPLTLPNVLETQQCLNSALNELRKNVSPENVLKFQSASELCLTSLQIDVQNVLCSSIIAGFSPFDSTLSISPDLQFITSTITVVVELKDSNKNNLLGVSPTSCYPFVLEKLNVTTTFGTLSEPKIENGKIIFLLSATSAGSGKITASFDGQDFATIILGSGNEITKIENQEKDFAFLETISLTKPRRDETDIVELS